MCSEACTWSHQRWRRHAIPLFTLRPQCCTVCTLRRAPLISRAVRFDLESLTVRAGRHSQIARPRLRRRPRGGLTRRLQTAFLSGKWFRPMRSIHGPNTFGVNPFRMRFHKLDLNLLVALDALLTERSITRAAEKLNLSQPATSNALARLRDYFEDDLLVQVGRQMEPTPRGQTLQARSVRWKRSRRCSARNTRRVRVDASRWRCRPRG